MSYHDGDMVYESKHYRLSRRFGWFGTQHPYVVLRRYYGYAGITGWSLFSTFKTEREALAELVRLKLLGNDVEL